MPRAISPDVAFEPGRGRSAERPRDIPARGWLDIAKRVKDRMARSQLSIIAAGVAFIRSSVPSSRSIVKTAASPNRPVMTRFIPSTPGIA